MAAASYEYECEEAGNKWEDGECKETGSAGLILGLIFGILGAAAIGVLIYYFVCKKQDDSFDKA